MAETIYQAEGTPPGEWSELFEGVPAELKKLKRWVCFKISPNPNDTRLDKKPFHPSHNPAMGCLYSACSNDPGTWTTFEACLAALSSTNRFQGIGYGLQPLYIGIDLDNCRDSVTGVIDDW